MNPLDAIRAELAALREKVARQRVTYRLGTVDASLAVTVAGESAPVAVAASLVALTDGDTVLMVTQNRRTYILGIVQ